MIKYFIDKHNKIVISKMTGDISFNELLNWHYELKLRDDYSPSYQGIADMRNANVMITHENIKELVELNKEKNFVSGQWACLVDTPEETAKAMLYQHEKANTHIMEMFSTDEAASNYLGVNVSDKLHALDNISPSLDTI